MRLQRQCIVINRRSAIVLIMIFVLTGIRNSETASGGNQMDLSDAKGDHKDNSNASNGNGNGNANENEVYVPPVVSSAAAKNGGGGGGGGGGGATGGLLDNITAYSSGTISNGNSNNNMLCPYDKDTPPATGPATRCPTVPSSECPAVAPAGTKEPLASEGYKCFIVCQPCIYN